VRWAEELSDIASGVCMTTQDVQQAYLRWQLAVGTWSYASKHLRGTDQERAAHDEMIDRYSAYLLARAEWEKGEAA
jgi:hypothetical protein